MGTSAPRGGRNAVKTIDMKQLLRLEELLMLVLGILLFSMLEYAWWVFPALILAPDIGMTGYTISKTAGAYTYNLLHHKGIAIGLYIMGFYLEWSVFMLIGVIIFSHASLDRLFGYGLKFTDSFQHTHLGWIGKQKNAK